MASSARRHFIISQSLAPTVINAVLNGWIAWEMHSEKPALPLWGGHGFWSDLMLTGALVPGITWLILRPLLLKQARTGKAPSLDGVPAPWATRYLPGSYWGGAAVAGVMGGMIGLLTAGFLHVAGVPAMPGATYAIFKGIYGGMLPIILQPSMAFAILSKASPVPVRAS